MGICVFVASGLSFDVDRYLKSSSFKPMSVFRKGQVPPKDNPEQQARPDSGFVVLLSEDQDLGLTRQIQEALVFLFKNEPELERLKKAGVDNMLLDFGVQVGDKIGTAGGHRYHRHYRRPFAPGDLQYQSSSPLHRLEEPLAPNRHCSGNVCLGFQDLSSGSQLADPPGVDGPALPVLPAAVDEYCLAVPDLHGQPWLGDLLGDKHRDAVGGSAPLDQLLLQLQWYHWQWLGRHAANRFGLEGKVRLGRPCAVLQPGP